MCDDACMSEEQEQSIRAHEARQHKWQDGKRQQRRLAADRQPRHRKSKWRGDHGGGDGREHAYRETVDYAVPIEGAGEDFCIIAKREIRSARIKKAGAENAIK